MNKQTGWVKNLLVRRILTVFLVGLTVFVIQGFGYGNALQALADNTVQSSEGIYYKGTPDETDKIKNDNPLVENARKNLKENVDNARDKFSYDNAVKTPEGTYYNARPDDNRVINRDIDNGDNDKNIIEQAKENFHKTAENIKEKLNLDEPVPESTKKFFGATEEKFQDTVEPITGNKTGYYDVD